MRETTFFPKLRDEYESGRLFTPGNRFCFEAGKQKIMYVALDPRQEPPEHGIFRPKWISVEERLPEDYELVLTVSTEGYIHIFSHAPSYKYPFGIGPHHPRYYPVTHWMPLPDPPEV